ncbi:hypothetical protein F8388_017072 [Cannabis sativa]|uniref:TF-B3 domain-containing protein n=1 Tax=Cannabis sativa TaxID=3483 RepID=A0A7J6GD16_CANSA|nr:hypothetical protein F8388_017072 [Cannabis sativa]
MPSDPSEESEKPIFLSKSSHFYKIILRDTLEENKLGIPHYFVKKCGETLTETVYIKLPCGSKWQMKIENCSGKFWLQKGFSEFMKHYSIGRGYVLTFRYDGNSELYVAIFDTTTMEIDYSSFPAHFDKSNNDEKLQIPKKEVIDDDDSIEILDDIYPCDNSGVTSPSAQSPKRIKTSPTGKLDSPFESDQVQSTAPRKTNNGIPRTIPLVNSEKYEALQRTSDFKSEHPYFKVVMQPYYIRKGRLHIEHQFAKNHLNKRYCDVILKVPKENDAWRVRYSFGECKKASPRLLRGWSAFVRDNNLKVGDVCAFVLVDAVNISFEVVRLDPERSSNSHMSTAHHESETPSFHNFSPAIQVKGCNSSQNSKPPLFGEQHLSAFNERVKFYENAAFESGNPFFKIVIERSNTWYACVPLDIADKHIKNDCDVTLSIPNGRFWSAQFRRRKCYTTGKTEAVICTGWKEFMAKNDLKLDDVCVFQLRHNGTEISFHISIVRVGSAAVVADDELKCQKPQRIKVPPLNLEGKM